MFQTRCRRNKYIVLEVMEYCGVRRGEILGVDQSGMMSRVHVETPLTEIRCSSKKVARLTDVQADYLMNISSLEERIIAFKAGSRFENPPTKGSKVFVAVNGRELCGIIRGRRCEHRRRLSPLRLCQSSFEVQILDCEVEMLYRKTDVPLCLTYNDIVLATLDELRPRYEKMECLPRLHTDLPYYQRPNLFEFRSSLTQTEEPKLDGVHKEKIDELERKLKKERQTRKEFEKRQPLIAIKSPSSTGSLDTVSRARSDFTYSGYRQLLRKENAEEKVYDLVVALDKETGARKELESLLSKSEKRVVEVESDLKVQLAAYEKVENLLKKYHERLGELEASLAIEQQAHEEAKIILEENNHKSSELEAILTSTKQSLEEKEKDLISSEQISDEFERELTIEQQISKELEVRLGKIKLKSTELEKKLVCEQKNRADTEKRLQIEEKKSRELETTLATQRKILKNKQDSIKECDWMLKREEIHLTEEKLGSGAFGTVYKGMFRGAQVAVKQVSLHARITDYNRDNFKREMRMAARCRHPQMLQFIGATIDEELPLLVTELLDTSLKAVLQERALETTEFTTLALDVALGLNYLHLMQPNPIVHRDISSGNVLLWKQGQCWRGKISDYGNAVLMNYARTGSGGAIPYLAPEMDNQKFSTKSDVYSYGVLLLEMYLRKEPSFCDDKDELICLVENGKLRELMRGCLQKDPERRSTVEEIIPILSGLTFE